MSLPGGCLWITGLSAAGKTTISSIIYNELNSIHDNIIKLDGDELRKIFKLSSSSYTREDRIQLGLTYSRLVKELVDQDIFVVIAVIGLYEEIHTWNRDNIKNYHDVFLDVPFDELIKRDPKGLYKKFNKGLVSNVAGFDFEVDFPTSPFCHIKWNNSLDPTAISDAIMTTLNNSLLNLSND